MAYERFGRDDRSGYYGRREQQDYGRDFGGGRDANYSSARSYQAAQGDDDRDWRREYGDRGYAPRGGQDRDFGRDQGPVRTEYHGSYGSDGRKFEDVGNRRDWDDDNRGASGERDRGRSYGRQPQGYDYDERGFLNRAGDEVRSWFGDDEAERRRDADMREDERHDRTAGRHHDADYHNWRSGQIAALDRDYDEYRQENHGKFHNEFSSWRGQRQTQRQMVDSVNEHMEVVGSDSEHVGTVDKVRGDRLLLTKTDKDADGHHHSIPSSWLQSVDDKVMLNKSADEAKRQWREVDRNQAMSDYGDNTKQRGQDKDDGAHMLNKSFSGTY